MLLALVGASSVALVLRLGRGPLPTALVDPADPAAVLDREITDTFGLARPVVWIVEARDGAIWTPAMLARVQAVTRDVFRIPGVVAPDVVSIASPNLRDLVVSEAGMRPTYLMGEVPTTPAALAALRARVDGDPMLRGQLVDVAGRAAMIVANFRAGVADDAIAEAALALRARHRDAEADVWVVGQPVLAALAAGAVPGLVRRAVLPTTVGGIAALLLLAGWRRTTAALAAALVTVAATLGLAGGAGLLVLPWTALAAVAAGLAAGLLAGGACARWRAAVGAAAGACVGLGAAALVAPGAERALAWGGVLALPLALAAAWAARTACGVGEPPRPGVGRGRGRALPVVVALLLGLGAVRLGPGFALSGYAARYLPAAAVPDVAALVRLFPPPESLALRVRGAPGFVASPAVLAAFDRVAAAAAEEPTVRHAMSLADLVEIVHRSFNEGRPDFAVVPDDRGLIARYLALAYSPGFRRFVDRALGSAAIWITIDGATPRDLARIEARVERALAATPVPEATVDRYGGDGALTLAMAASARRVALGSLGVLAVALAGLAVAAGRVAAGRALRRAVLLVVALAGLLGWAGQALDLVTVPLLAGAALAAVLAV